MTTRLTPDTFDWLNDVVHLSFLSIAAAGLLSVMLIGVLIVWIKVLTARNKQAEESLDELKGSLNQIDLDHPQEFQVLYELSHRIGYTLNCVELFSTIQSSLSEIVDFDLSASLVIEDLSSGAAESVLTYYLQYPVTPVFLEATKDNLLDLFRKMAPALPENMRTLELHDKTYSADQAPLAGELASFFNVPLVVDGSIKGCLYVASCQPDAFDENHIRILYAVAKQASIALQRSQEFLLQERAHLEAVVEGMAEGVVLLNQQGLIHLSNPAGMKAFFQMGTRKISPDAHFTAIANTPLEDIQTQIQKNPEGIKIIYSEEMENCVVEIRIRSLQVIHDPMLLFIFHDITEQHRYQKKLEELSMTDPLTGLANRRKFFEVLGREIVRARRYGSFTTLIMLDLDGLKLINDQYGHKTGDQALINISQVLNLTARDADLAARYAGDEFMVLLPNTSLADGRRLADRLLSAVNQKSINGQNLSVSIGITELTSDDDDQGSSLVERVDQALYRAKQNGRRCIISLPVEGIFEQDQ